MISVKDANRLGYSPAKKLSDGQVIGIIRMNFTWGLFVGIDESGNRGRYCYPTMSDAAQALSDWDGKGDPPGPWIKRKVAGMEEVVGPGYAVRERA